MKFNRVIEYDRENLSDEFLIDIYKKLLYPRMIEEKMILLLRQNKISKWFSGIGQEAISIGTSISMMDEEHILPMHRNLGVFTTRGVPLTRLFSQWQGKANGFTNGRDRSFHFGTNEYNLHGMISHLGPQMGVADGIGLAYKLKDQKQATIVFTGDGGTSEGDFHEALNVASVWELPVLFCIENNGYGLSTPSSEQFKVDFGKRGAAYGIKSYSIDGNNVLEVYKTANKLLKQIRKNSKPVILSCDTFRMRGHEESSGTKYIPKDVMEYWAKRDPVLNYEQYLLDINVLKEKDVKEIRTEFKSSINNDNDSNLNEKSIESSEEQELKSVFKSYDFKQVQPSRNTNEMRFVDAISDGLDQAMQKYKDLIIMGQDVADYGGVFKVTEGFLKKYGNSRIRNTPLCESVILSAGVGLSVKGIKSIIEMQFADFVSTGFTAIVNNMAKLHYRWGQNVDSVVRMPTGAGVGAGPFHSQSNEAWFAKVPGLKIYYPSNPIDAKGLLLRAIEEPNPVMFFEHKALYRKISGEVPEGYYNIDEGKAALINEGSKCSIITYGMGVHWAKEIIEKNDIDADLIDLRTLIPWDKETVSESIKKTNRVIILQEDTQTMGFGSEISAWISRNLFEHLDAPVNLVGSLDTPVPFAGELEKKFLPKDRFEKAILDLIKY